MKKNILIILTIILFSASIFAQNTPAMKVYGLPIDSLRIMVKQHPKYFDHLKNKWLKAPEKMKEDELMLLYYGSAFMKNYKPVQEDKAIEKIAQTMAEFDFEKALKEGQQLVNVYPLNSRLYMLLGYTFKKIGQKKKAEYYYKKYADLIRIPLYSGSGKNYDQAFIVRNISDEYLILNQKDLELVLQEVRYKNQKPFDVLGVKPKSKNNKRMSVLPKEKLYFNIYLPFFIGQHKTYKMLQAEAKRKYKIKEK